jgi:hypothetical protein
MANEKHHCPVCRKCCDQNCYRLGHLVACERCNFGFAPTRHRGTCPRCQNKKEREEQRLKKEADEAGKKGKKKKGGSEKK